MPLAFISMGRHPNTKVECITMVESHNATLLDPAEFKHINSNAYPVVFAYNGRDHFSPTKFCTSAQYNHWKTDKELGSLLSATMHVCAEIDVAQLPPDVYQAITEVRACIARNLPVLSKHGVGYYQQRRKKNISTHHGPAVDPTGVEVPLPPGPEDPPPSSSFTPAAPAGKGKKKGRQGFTCAECGITKYRKPDFEGHLWSKHGLGKPIVCNLSECDNASYSSQSSLKQHIRTMHEKKFKFNCKKCSYGTHNQDCLTSHRINKHKEKFVTQSGKKVKFKCKLCYKVFGAPHLLRKHKRTVECTAEKTLPCPDCGKMFKTQEGLQYHRQQQHQGQKSPCPTCGKMVAERSMPNHMKFLLAKEHFKGQETSKPKLKGERGPSSFLHLYWPRGRSLPGRRQLHLSLLLPK